MDRGFGRKSSRFIRLRDAGLFGNWVRSAIFADSTRDDAHRDWVRSANFSPIPRATIRAERARDWVRSANFLPAPRATIQPNCQGAMGSETPPSSQGLRKGVRIFRILEIVAVEWVGCAEWLVYLAGRRESAFSSCKIVHRRRNPILE